MNDKDNRNLALNENESFIIQAPAGSGKTELLTQRYLKLLSVSHNPENVIVMTFTKKAVNELTKRVIDSLMLTKYPRPKEPHKQQTFDLAFAVMQKSSKEQWQLLEMPHRLKISTIDSLSNLITNRYPVMGEIASKRIMEQQWERYKSYKQAAEQTLLAINDDEYKQIIESVLLHLDNNIEKFYRLVIQMLSKRDQWLSRLYKGETLDPKILKESSSRIIIQHLSALEKEAKKCIHADFFDAISLNSFKEYSQIKAIPGARLDDLRNWKSICSLCLTGDKWRKTVNVNNGFAKELKEKKDSFILVLDELRSNDILRQLLYELLLLPDIELQNEQATIMHDISQVLKLCVAQLQIIFKNEQACDYIEIALQADNALDDRESISDIALYLDYKINHILIDEFQDTSSTQFSLIERLINNWQKNSDKTIFLVGDPMQSIYRFRESQVGLFLQVKEFGIADIKPKFLQLDANFRSTKSLVDENNKIFSHIFPKLENIYNGAISYSYAYADSNVVDDCPVEMHLFSLHQQHKEAQQVVQIIKDTINLYPSNEVAVLVRNRSHLGDIVPMLTNQGIDFEALKTTPLRDHLFTRDLLSLTRSILHLGDKLAWLSVLRAPWCGLLLEDLLILSENKDKVIFEQLFDEEIIGKLSVDSQPRARHIAAIMGNVIDNIGRFNFVELLAFAIDRLIPDNSTNIQESMIKEQYIQIINDCESTQSLDIENIKSMLDELYAPSTESKVKLMTIHQAKGLEFDTVIIPGLGRRPQYSKPPIIYIKEFADNSLLLAPTKSYLARDDNNTYSYLKHIDSQQDKHEIMRLLYVAMTRAKRKVHLLGSTNKSNNANSKTFLELLMYFFIDKHESVSGLVENITITKKEAPKLKRYSMFQDIDNLVENDYEQINYQFTLDRIYKSLIGTLVHQYLELGNFNPGKRVINIDLMRIGIPPNKINESIDFIIDMLNNTKQDPIFNWLFKARDSTLVEAEFVAQSNNIIIDRLFVENDILWVIDYKTAAPFDGESLSMFESRQKKEHAKQLSVYKKILAGIYKNEIKCAIYCPATQQLIEV